MDKIISVCGIVCNDCPAFIATKNNDEEMKKELADKWSSESYIVTPEDINCEGCISNSDVHFKFCGECQARLCGIKKSIINCSKCDEYPCEKLRAEDIERLDMLK